MLSMYQATAAALFLVAALVRTRAASSASDAPMHPEAAVAAIRSSIVQIVANSEAHPGVLGTGFLVTDDGYIITANHVVAGAQGIVSAAFALENSASIRGNFVLTPARIVDIDKRHDLALLKVAPPPAGTEPGNVPALIGTAVLATARPKDGATIGVSGYPLFQQVLISTFGAIASSWEFESVEVARPGAPGAPPWVFTESNDFYLADIHVNPGNSGGPVYLVPSGHVVGVCQAFMNAPVMDTAPKEGAKVDNHLVVNSGLAAVIPTRYVVELLKKNGVTTFKQSAN